MSLNSVLWHYLGVENTKKDVVVTLMKADPLLWWNVSFNGPHLFNRDL
jgi:hypothetical protein